MKHVLILTMIAALTGCSMFADSKQSLSIAGNSKHSRVTVNSIPTQVPSQIAVDRDHSVTVNAYDGDHLTFSKTLVPVPSTTGKLDTMGSYFLFPGLGLFYPGAMELESDSVTVE